MEISPRYTVETYSLLTHNCNNFSNEVAQFLVGSNIPDYILQLPSEVMSNPMGALLMPMIQNLETTFRAGAVPQVPQFRPSVSAQSSQSTTISVNGSSISSQPKEVDNKVKDGEQPKSEEVKTSEKTIPPSKPIGKKVNSIDVVYTPWSNLKKTPSMDVGQVGFYNSKMVRTVRVEKRIHETVNRLNKTKVERKPDLKAKKEAVYAAEKTQRKQQLKEKKRRVEMQRLERQAEIRSYEDLMVPEKMTSNKQIAATSKSFQEVEEDFM
ncbi:deSI-like protein [Gossypium australe]|uniref:DeSI-like protein n=1 Tax=Gossypium australe TaxID=47621 RepID=A0A5B6WF33_9ROSI|nr:deSI-like protein [Gossypium australe]